MRESAGSRQHGELSGTGSEASLLRQALTAPNILSILRLAGVPLFLWLLLGPQEDGWALLVLVLSAGTDWLDGKLARWLNQMSRLGEVLDPAADRLYIVATLVAFLVRDIVPWWAVVALLVREVVAAVCVLVLRYYRFRPPEVTYVGKGATFVLMYAFPLLLLMQGDSMAAEIVRPLAYAFTIWGGALYLWSGALYVIQTVLAVFRFRRGTLETAARSNNPHSPSRTPPTGPSGPRGLRGPPGRRVRFRTDARAATVP
nr:CDP-alcohol phosphatidyltransferase family protein [Saccharomonospora sp. CUA-673]